MQIFGRKHKPDFNYSFPLNPEKIDYYSERVFDLLMSMQMERKNALRVRLALESILLSWMENIGPEHACTIALRKQGGSHSLRVSVEGGAFNPIAQDKEGEEDLSSSGNLLNCLGLYPRYHFSRGVNHIDLYLQKPGINALMQIVLAILLAVGLGLLGGLLPAETSHFISEVVLLKLFEAFTRLLTLISGPLIFLSVLSGIFNVGNKEALGKMGGGLMRIVFLNSFLIALIALPIARPVIAGTAQGGTNMAASAFADVYSMILDIIPGNIISPFISGNTMQLIFIAICLGLSVIIIGSKGSPIARSTQELSRTVHLLMSFINRMMPAFVFVSILRMTLNGTAAEALKISTLILYLGICLLFVLIFYPLMMWLRYKVPPFKLLKKLMPTMVIAISTASSAAAFATNVEACEKKLGIDRRVLDFAIPLGQVFFMPGAACLFLLSALFVAQLSGMPITLSWLILAFILSVVLAIAAPPVPGGALTCFTILIMQLGLPAEYLPVLLSVDLLLEFIATAINIFCLQNHLVPMADRIGMLDKELLRK